MTRWRAALPQLAGDLFLTDGGIETTLIFHDGLPDFAAFDLLRRPERTEALRRYFRTYAPLGVENGLYVDYPLRAGQLADGDGLGGRGHVGRAYPNGPGNSMRAACEPGTGAVVSACPGPASSGGRRASAGHPVGSPI
jgi:hypothetical protein